MMPKPKPDAQLTLFDANLGIEYDHDWIRHHPIAVVCLKGKSPQCRNMPEQIYAPQLDNVRCFWCGSKMQALDAVAYQMRRATLWQHVNRTSERAP